MSNLQGRAVHIVGAAGVGKTELAKQVAGPFYNPSGGIPYSVVQSVPFELLLIGGKVIIRLYDGMGLPEYMDDANGCFKDPAAVIFVYDVNNRASFDAIPAMLDEIAGIAQQSFLGVLIGNVRAGEWDKRVVSELEGFNMAEELGIKFCEINFRNRITVLAEFEKITENLLNGEFGVQHSEPCLNRSLDVEDGSELLATESRKIGCFGKLCTIL